MTPGPSLQILFQTNRFRLCNGTKSRQANLFFCVCLVLKDLLEGSLAFLLQTVCAWASVQKKIQGFSRRVNMSLAAEISLVRETVAVSRTSQTVTPYVCTLEQLHPAVFNWCCL